MPNQIQVLDPHVADLIAAGEVVERPASVVKELVENAVDAGAHTLTVEIQRGGMAMIRVTDDGGGIPADQCQTAFLRHATSKLRTAQDLAAIGTLGFRGEALAAIAAVSRVELFTRTAQCDLGPSLTLEGGQVLSQEPAGCPLGTTLVVRDLFYNTPARLKFMKRDAAEGAAVFALVQKLALSHPGVSFQFIRDGKRELMTPGDGKLSSALYAVLGRDMALGFTPVRGEGEDVTVTGFVSLPACCRGSRTYQHFFVNGRPVKSKLLMAALERAYENQKMVGKFPGCVLQLQVKASQVDVNVHPAKTEVRFAREKDVFDAVYQSVKCVLITPQSTEKVFSFGGAERAFPADEKAPDAAAKKEPSESAPAEEPARGPGALRPASRAVPDAPVRPVPARPEPSAVPLPGQVKAYSEMITALSSESTVPYRSAKAPDIWADEDAAEDVGFMPHTVCRRQEGTPGVQTLPEDRALNSFAAGETAGTENTAAPQMEAETPHQTAFAPVEEEQRRDSLRFVGEVFDTYIVTQRGNDMCLLDKHAAHERIIYESLAASYGKVSSQMLLVPVTVQLSAEEKDALVQSEMLLQDSGLEVEDFGGNSVVVRAVPADVVPEDVEDLVVELASRLVSNPRYTTSEKTEWVLHSIACRAAIKAGDKTHAAQLLRLAEDVLDGRVPPFCPHGRPIVLKITKKELEKQFGRQG